MKVLHLATSGSGGAGIAAIRLHNALRSVGVSSHLHSLSGIEDLDGASTIRTSSRTRLLSKSVTLLQECLRHTEGLMTPMSLSTYLPLDSALQAFDIVHIHNWYNFASLRTWTHLTRQRTRIVFTLHDERLFTGGCHYTLDCDNYELGCARCPQSGRLLQPMVSRSFTREAEALSRSGASFVAPSRWLFDRARHSLKLAGATIDHVPNPIDTEIFSPARGRAAREALGIGRHEFVIAWLPGKNPNLFASAVEEFSSFLTKDQRRLCCVLTTSGAPKITADIRVRIVPAPTSETQRAEFWSAATIGLTTTLADNFPNVVLESLACGTPMIVPRVGGTAEAVELTAGGITVEDRSPRAFATALIHARHRHLNESLPTDALAARVAELYAPSTIGRKMCAVYAKAMSS